MELTPRQLAMKLNGIARRNSTPTNDADILDEAAKAIRSLLAERDYAVRCLRNVVNRHGDCDGCKHLKGNPQEGCGDATCDTLKNNHWEWCGKARRNTRGEHK